MANLRVANKPLRPRAEGGGRRGEAPKARGERREANGERRACGAVGLRLRICTKVCIISLVRMVWDEAKRRANLRKHGLDFADALAVFSGITCTIEDRRFDYGEQRFVTLGMLRDTVVVTAHAEARDRIRIISMRKATRHEQILYFQNI
jgi:uncharacterized DUF497 family protein